MRFDVLQRRTKENVCSKAHRYGDALYLSHRQQGLDPNVRSADVLYYAGFFHTPHKVLLIPQAALVSSRCLTCRQDRVPYHTFEMLLAFG